jgi:hypothetical protein
LVSKTLVAAAGAVEMWETPEANAEAFSKAALSLKGIRDGFFDPSSIRKCGSDLNRKIEAGSLDASFQAAWDFYHDSFDDNQDDVLDAIYKSFFKGVKYIAPMNMSSTVALFKALGREGQASEMLKHYVEV